LGGEGLGTLTRGKKKKRKEKRKRTRLIFLSPQRKKKKKKGGGGGVPLSLAHQGEKKKGLAKCSSKEEREGGRKKNQDLSLFRGEGEEEKEPGEFPIYGKEGRNPFLRPMKREGSRDLPFLSEGRRRKREGKARFLY